MDDGWECPMCEAVHPSRPGRSKSFVVIHKVWWILIVLAVLIMAIVNVWEVFS